MLDTSIAFHLSSGTLFAQSGIAAEGSDTFIITCLMRSTWSKKDNNQIKTLQSSKQAANPFMLKSDQFQISQDTYEPALTQLIND